MELAEETDEEGSTLYDYAFSLDGEEADFTDVLQQLEALSSTGAPRVSALLLAKR